MRRSDGLIHVLALAPLVWIAFDQLTGQRSINPIQTWTQRSGFSALALLLASLACTPANRIAGVRRAAAWRRPLGLYGFGYALIHVLIFIVIIIGGLGSTVGCLIGALLVGLLANYTGFLAPKMALFSNIALMVAVLLWRPQGLYPVARR